MQVPAGNPVLKVRERKTRAIGLPGVGEWKSVKEIAEALSCNPQTVRRWVWSGKLRETWFGRIRRIYWPDVLALGREVSPCKSPNPKAGKGKGKA